MGKKSSMESVGLVKKYPYVTITIPTYNSGRTLSLCLDAVSQQTYKRLEVLLIDSGSTDNTAAIAKKYSYQLIHVKGGLLMSRLKGIQKAKGDYVLLLDSDQILNPDAIERAVDLCETKSVDMLAFEEKVFETKTFMQKLFAADRKIIETARDYNPYTSAILPRFFRRSLLLSAIQSIPSSIIDTVGGPDHAILYYESWLISKKITTLPNAVKHMEASSVIAVMKKCYRWGYTGVSAKTEPKYLELMSQKEHLRKGLFGKGVFFESLASILLLIIKGIPYKLGYVIGKIYV